MPLAARVGDDHRCLVVEPAPHVGGPILDPGSRTVFIGDKNAARVGDRALCTRDTHDVIDAGEPTVTIGSEVRARSLRAAAITDSPFCAKESRSRVAAADD